jgi:alanine dehydrogenase
VIIGIPQEIKSEERRVAIVPEGVEALTRHGHKVVIETNAGVGSGFSDSEYARSGAEIGPNPSSIYNQSEMILKVKEPLPSEYDLLQKGQILFTFLHLASSESLTSGLLRSGVTAIAYETIATDSGMLPLLTPMSEIAGRMAPQEGAKYLEHTYGGRGVLLSGAPGVPPASVVILGAGTVGSNATLIALGLGASVTVLDNDPQKLRAIDTLFRGRIATMVANPQNITTTLSYADLVIGAVLVPGAKAPRLISRQLLREMKKGAVLVDVAVDQGGCAETTHPTTHDNPTYIEENIVHYTVANMPGAVPRTATRSLTLNTLPYVLDVADKGWVIAASQDMKIARGINLIDGTVVCQAISQAFDLPYVHVEKYLR